jgi:hypothetical protein
MAQPGANKAVGDLQGTFALRTSHFALRTSHFALRTSHFALRTPRPGSRLDSPIVAIRWVRISDESGVWAGVALGCFRDDIAAGAAS